MQRRVFGMTWITYAGYYLCRKNLSVAIPFMLAGSHFTQIDLANCVLAFSLPYAAAQIAIGPLVNKHGTRAVVGWGLLVVIASNLLLSWCSSPSAMIGLCFLHGVGQATGWPALVSCLANWFPATNRGIKMGWWATNYAFGGFFATIFATFCVTNTSLFPHSGWRGAFLLPALLLAVICISFLMRVPNRPFEAGGSSVHRGIPPFAWASVAHLLHRKEIWIIGVACFLLQMARYAFLFWLPLYLFRTLSLSPRLAGSLSSSFELFGIAGVIAAGYLSDRLFGERRIPAAATMLACFGFTILLQPTLGSIGLIATALGLSLMGVFCYGADNILCGAAAQDVGGQQQAGAAAGFIDCMGHLGAIVSPYLITAFVQHFGWNSLFFLLGILAVAAAVILFPLWDLRQKDLTYQAYSAMPLQRS